MRNSDRIIFLPIILTFLFIAFLIAFAARADSSHGGDGGSAIAGGGSARSDSDSTAISGAKSDSTSVSLSGSQAGAGAAAKIDVGDITTTVAAPAGDVHPNATASDSTVCGSNGGVAVQGGLFGGGIGGETFACLALRHALYQANPAIPDRDKRIEGFSWYFPPFLAWRMVRCAATN